LLTLFRRNKTIPLLEKKSQPANITQENILMKTTEPAGIHLVLISDQAVPNITPILDERFRPREIIMLVSQDKQQQADQLERIYRPRGIQTKRWAIDNPWDIEYIRDRVMELMEDYEQEDIALNATGGTKPMSIAAYEVFRSLDKAIFYIHPEKDRLIWLCPENRASTDLADKIKLKEFIIAYGAYDVSIGHRVGVKPELRELTEELINNIKEYSEKLTDLNYLAGTASRQQLVSPEIGKDKRGDHVFWRLIDVFEQAKLLRHEDNRLHFPDEQARFMVNGGWLEMHTYACCLNIKKHCRIQDVARSIEVSYQQGKRLVTNEIDIGFLRDNRLHLIECKTKVFSGNNAKHDEGAEVLYKLDSLRKKIGGNQTRAMLVSVKKMQKHHRDRARELNIQTCVYDELTNLEQKIEQWLQ
jgi:hypothetical protein